MRKSVYAICEQQRRRFPAHSRSLFSAFIVRWLDNVIPLVSKSEISSFYQASVTAQAGLSVPLSETPKTEAQLYIHCDEAQMRSHSKTNW